MAPRRKSQPPPPSSSSSSDSSSVASESDLKLSSKVITNRKNMNKVTKPSSSDSSSDDSTSSCSESSTSSDSSSSESSSDDVSSSSSSEATSSEESSTNESSSEAESSSESSEESSSSESSSSESSSESSSDESSSDESSSDESSSEESSSDESSSDEPSEQSSSEESSSSESSENSSDNDVKEQKHFRKESHKLSAPSPSSSPPPSGSTLFVGNLPYDATKDALMELFSSFGSVQNVRLVTDQRTGRSKGFAYVVFTTDGAVDDAINAGDLELSGRTLKVDRANARPVASDSQKFNRASSSAPSSPGTSSPPTPTLFVGNLAFSVTESMLRDAFASYGEIVSCRIPTNAEDGRSRGYGFVQFSETASAVAAHSAPRFEIEGRFVRLDFDNPASSPRKREFNGHQGGNGHRGGHRGGRASAGSPPPGKHQRYFD